MLDVCAVPDEMSDAVAVYILRLSLMLSAMDTVGSEGSRLVSVVGSTSPRHSEGFC